MDTDTPRTDRPTQEALTPDAWWAERITITDEGCWEWARSRNSQGYGAWAGGDLAHRYSYKHHLGPIPEGRIICHRCGNPPCVNPEHLYAGTHADNAADWRSSPDWKPPVVGTGYGESFGYLTTVDVAARLGVKAASIRRYRERGFPKPDRYVGRTPLWLAASVDAWAAARPGQGAGGGPKPKDPR